MTILPLIGISFSGVIVTTKNDKPPTIFDELGSRLYAAISCPLVKAYAL